MLILTLDEGATYRVTSYPFSPLLLPAYQAGEAQL